MQNKKPPKRRRSRSPIYKFEGGAGVELEPGEAGAAQFYTYSSMLSEKKKLQMKYTQDGLMSTLRERKRRKKHVPVTLTKIFNLSEIFLLCINKKFLDNNYFIYRTHFTTLILI